MMANTLEIELGGLMKLIEPIVAWLMKGQIV